MELKNCGLTYAKVGGNQTRPSECGWQFCGLNFCRVGGRVGTGSCIKTYPRCMNWLCVAHFLSWDTLFWLNMGGRAWPCFKLVTQTFWFPRRPYPLWGVDVGWKGEMWDRRKERGYRVWYVKQKKILIKNMKKVRILLYLVIQGIYLLLMVYKMSVKAGRRSLSPKQIQRTRL